MMVLATIVLFIVLQAVLTIEVIRTLRVEGFRRFFQTWHDVLGVLYVATGWVILWWITDPAVVVAIQGG